MYSLCAWPRWRVARKAVGGTRWGLGFWATMLAGVQSCGGRVAAFVASWVEGLDGQVWMDACLACLRVWVLPSLSCGLVGRAEWEQAWAGRVGAERRERASHRSRLCMYYARWSGAWRDSWPLGVRVCVSFFGAAYPAVCLGAGFGLIGGSPPPGMTGFTIGDFGNGLAMEASSYWPSSHAVWG